MAGTEEPNKGPIISDRARPSYGPYGGNVRANKGADDFRPSPPLIGPHWLRYQNCSKIVLATLVYRSRVCLSRIRSYACRVCYCEQQSTIPLTTFTMNVPSKPSDHYSYPDPLLHAMRPMLWAKGSELNEWNRNILGDIFDTWYTSVNEERYDKAVRDCANPDWITGFLQKDAARHTIEDSSAFCDSYESEDEDSDEYPEFICANDGRSITKTEVNLGMARNMANALITCTPVWAPFILKKGEDNRCVCPCARMLQSYMTTQHVYVGEHCDNKFFDPQGLLQHLRANGDIYHQTAYHMLKQMMTGFHAPTVDHYGINGAPKGEHTPGHKPKRDDDATRHCYTCRVKESDISPLVQRPLECRHSYCSTCWSKWDALPIKENISKRTRRL